MKVHIPMESGNFEGAKGRPIVRDAILYCTTMVKRTDCAMCSCVVFDRYASLAQ